MGFLRFLVGLIFLIAIGIFAVFNNETVSVLYSPLHEPHDIPLYIVGLGFMAFGFLWGGFNVWVNGSHVRKDRRDFKKQLAQAEKELDYIKGEIRKAQNEQTRQENAEADIVPSDAPAIPSRGI